MSAPQSAGTAPPIVEPIKIATQIKARDGMTKAYDIRPAHALHDPLPGAGCKPRPMARCPGSAIF